MNNCNKIYFDKNCNTIVNDTFEEGYVYVYILQLNQTYDTKNQTIIRTNIDDEIKFDLGLDGFYTLITIKISTDISKPYYYKNGKFYKNIKEVELSEIINVNPEISEVEVNYDYYFQTCHLRQCYVSICQKIFDSQANIDCNKSNLDKELVYKRDLVWSALNVIKYMAEQDQFEEAERLLEKITRCNGLCPNSGCGCKSVPKDCGCK